MTRQLGKQALVDTAAVLMDERQAPNNVTLQKSARRAATATVRPSSTTRIAGRGDSGREMRQT